MSTRAIRTRKKARLKREAPRRGAPVRNVTMAFRNDGGAETPPNPPGGERGVAPEHGAAGGVVEQAVATAYRVFEEYMQRGRQAAERHHQQDETGGPMKQERQLDPATMAMQVWSNMAQAWFGAMAPLMAFGSMPGFGGLGGAGGPWRGWDFGGNAPPPPFGQAQAQGQAGATGHRLALAVEVTSAHPTEVLVELHDERSAQRQLHVHELVGDGGHTIAGGAVRFEHVGHGHGHEGGGRHGAHGEHLRVHVDVPADLAPGAYRGAIIDKEQAGVGRLVIVVRHR